MGSRKRHLLVVDDDTLSARIVEQTLKAKGYTVSTASNGSAALYILAHNATVDMVVADHHAPTSGTIWRSNTSSKIFMTTPPRCWARWCR